MLAPSSLLSTTAMTDNAAEPSPHFDPKRMAKFYTATALFFKRKAPTLEPIAGCRIPGLDVSESTWAKWDAAVKSQTP